MHRLELAGIALLSLHAGPQQVSNAHLDAATRVLASWSNRPAVTNTIPHQQTKKQATDDTKNPANQEAVPHMSIPANGALVKFLRQFLVDSSVMRPSRGLL